MSHFSTGLYLQIIAHLTQCMKSDIIKVSEIIQGEVMYEPPESKKVQLCYE